MGLIEELIWEVLLNTHERRKHRREASGCTDAGVWGLLTQVVHKSYFILNSTSRWSCCNWGWGGESPGRNILHLKSEFCKLWQHCHSCPCELLEPCKWLGNTHEGAQSLHSNKNCHHYKDIRIINSTRSNINPKGIPKLASSEEQTLLNKQEFFWGGKVMPMYFLFIIPFLIL